MNDGGRRAKQAVISAGTAAYAAILVAATHHPKPERFLGNNPPSDKLLHFMAYALLGSLAAVAVRARGRLTGKKAVALAVGLAVFAALDEITQPIFSRAAEPLDWVFDCLGIAVGIAAVMVISSWASARGSR